MKWYHKFLVAFSVLCFSQVGKAQWNYLEVDSQKFALFDGSTPSVDNFFSIEWFTCWRRYLDFAYV